MVTHSKKVTYSNVNDNVHVTHTYKDMF